MSYSAALEVDELVPSTEELVLVVFDVDHNIKNIPNLLLLFLTHIKVHFHVDVVGELACQVLVIL